MKKNLLLSLCILIALLPLLVFRDYTPSNELRYLSIVDEAFASGNFFTFTNQGIPYADKPPLYFWLMMFSHWLLGGHYMWLLGLFSFIPALVVMVVMDRWVANSISDKNRLTGKLLLMSCGLFLGMSIVLRMDMLMCMFIVLALYTFYKMLIDKGSQRVYSYLFPLYIFFAIFSKGPIGILIPLLSTVLFLILTKRTRLIKQYWGWKTWSVILSGCMLWFLGVYLEGGTAYLNDLLFNQTVNRAINSFHHDAPFYYYFASVWYSLAPWSLLLIGILVVSTWRGWIQTELECFFATILVTTVMMLSCISSKIAVYLLPAFPFFVYLAVLLLSRFRWNGWLALSIGLPAAVFVITTPVLCWIGKQPETLYLGQPLLYLTAGVLSLSGLLTLYYLYAQKRINRSIHTLVVGLFIAVFVAGWELPALNSRLGFANLCTKASAVYKDKNALGYLTFKIRRAESMDVFLHQDVIPITDNDIRLNSYSGYLLLVPTRFVEKSIHVRTLIAGKESHAVGDYLIVVL